MATGLTAGRHDLLACCRLYRSVLCAETDSRLGGAETARNMINMHLGIIYPARVSSPSTAILGAVTGISYPSPRRTITLGSLRSKRLHGATVAPTIVDFTDR